MVTTPDQQPHHLWCNNPPCKFKGGRVGTTSWTCLVTDPKLYLCCGPDDIILARVGCASHHIARQNDPAAIAAAARAEERVRPLKVLEDIVEKCGIDHWEFREGYKQKKGPTIEDHFTIFWKSGGGGPSTQFEYLVLRYLDELRIQQPGGEDGGAGK